MELQRRRVRIPLRGVWADREKGFVLIPKHAIVRIVRESIEGEREGIVTGFVGARKLLFYAQDVWERTIEI